MTATDHRAIAERRFRRKPATLADLLTIVGQTSGVANIVMQLSLPPVGHGVHESRVESGSPRRRPIKRARTTGQYLVVAVVGNENDRARLREEIAQVHARVHSTPSSPVKYSGNARDLQLWVAACLFRYFIDQYEYLYGPLDEASLDTLTKAGAPLATGVQVHESAWPQSWAEFQAYWDATLPTLSVAPEVRRDFQSLADLTFLSEAWGLPGAVLATMFGRFYHFLTRGNLRPEFLELLGWSWTEADQRWFDRVLRVLRLVDVVNPFVLKALYHVSLYDLRFRMRFVGNDLGTISLSDEPLGDQAPTPRQRRRARRRSI